MASNGRLPASVWPSKTLPAPKLSDALGQITDFLDKLGYKKTVKALAKESIDKGTPVNLAEWRAGDRMVPAKEYLGTLYMDILLQDEEESEESEQADDSSSSEDESSESSSESEDEKEEEKAVVTKSVATPAKAGASKKRVREADSDSSNSDSNFSDSEDSDEAPPAKKIKNDSTSEVESSEDDSSDSDSSSDDSDSSKEPAAVSKPPNKKLKTVAKKIVSQPTASTSSASSGTLAGSPQPPAVVEASTMHPARQQRMDQSNGGAKGKKGAAGPNEPFSRIPKDTRVDPRFASNAYVSYDYADKAHKDLIVTKGKGFTKEKNKKKRGSYRGGMIDTTPKGIKFDD